MHVVQSFGIGVLAWGVVGVLALLGHRVARLIRIPASAIFLVAAAIAASEVKAVRNAVTLPRVVDLVTLALIVILFDGGLHLGARRFREAATPILMLGVFATFATTALLGVLGHEVFGLPWKVAFVLGAALAPTDPAVVFSVLANRSLTGRTSAILEGESGFNDPAGIALLIGFVALATHAHGSFWSVLITFAIDMGVGAAIGLSGGRALEWLLSSREPSAAAQQPLRALAGILVIYGVATVAHGSGFLAVLIAGIVMGDRESKHGASIQRFHATLASLGEIVAFVLLGLSVRVHSLADNYAWLIGVGLFAFMALAVRPLVVIPLLARAHLGLREKVFISWAGLKGAVPILLGTIAVTGHVPDAQRVYAVVFVVVAISVALQGGSLGFVARKLGVATNDDSDGRPNETATH